jgi:hypothetical protein
MGRVNISIDFALIYIFLIIIYIKILGLKIEFIRKRIINFIITINNIISVQNLEKELYK